MSIDSASNRFRMNGLATGLNTDDMVKKMLMADKIKITKAEGIKKRLEWKQELFRDILEKTKSFKSKYMDILNSEKYLLSEEKFFSYKVKSQSNAIEMKTFGKVEVGTYKVNVMKVAERAKINSDSSDTVRVTGGEKGKLSTKISELVNNEGYSVGDGDTLKIKVQVNSVEHEIIVDNSGEKSISDVINSINQYRDSSGNQILIAEFSELSGKFTLSTLKTGQSNEIELKDINIGGVSRNSLLGISKNTSDTGQNSEVSIQKPGDSDVYTVTNEKNTFTIDNINYLVKSESSEAEEFSVGKDIDKTVDRFKEFIKDYNDMVNGIYEKYSEKKQYSYEPLTEEQKKDMSEDEVKLWEEKAKEGLLKNDSDLYRMLQSMRRAFFDQVGGSDVSFGMQIGIDSSKDFKKFGEIVISDENRLREVLTETPEKIARLFGKKADGGATDKYGSSGIIHRISTILDEYTSPRRTGSDGKKGVLVEKAGVKNDSSFFNNLISNEVVRQNAAINKLQRIMNSHESQYYNMFARLESSMNKLNSQSTWLQSQLGAM